jgi:hypothetical protein
MDQCLSHNLFAFAPKELSHSAFWAWLLEGLNSTEETLQRPARNLLRELGVEHSGGNVTVSTEHSFGDGCRADIAVSFEDGSNVFIECKRSSPVDENQISRYERESENQTRIAVLSTHFDTRALDRLDVPSLDTSKQGRLLDEYRDSHPIIDQYAEWLDELQSRRAELKRKAMSSDYSAVEEALSRRVGQWHLMCRITDDMTGEYSRGTNRGGNPWTQFAICSSGDDSDRLFYRIDRYKSGYYLSLRQYLGRRDHRAWEGKEERLEHLRRRWEESVDEVQPDLNFKSPHNRGTKECEIACLMLEDNSSSRLAREVPPVHRAFADRLHAHGWPLF